MNILVQDIVMQCSILHCANLQLTKVAELLQNKGIKNAYEFGEHYNFNNPYKGFLYDYLARN